MTEAAKPLTTESFPIAHLDLVEEVRQLRHSPISHDHVAKTVLHHRDLRMVLMVMKAGARIPRHHAKGSMTIQALDGRAVVTLLDSSFDLGPGKVLAIEPDLTHAVVAIEDTALILTIAFSH